MNENASIKDYADLADGRHFSTSLCAPPHLCVNLFSEEGNHGSNC